MRRFKGKETGHRSGFEQSGQQLLEKNGIKFQYEPKDKKLSYIKPSTSHKYLVDYILPNNIHCELKGRLTSADRIKMLLVIAQNPHIQFRMVFQKPQQKLYKNSPTTYAKWCEKNNIIWGELKDMIAWAKEPSKK